MEKESLSRKRLTKWEIACACEALPGVTPRSAMSLMTVSYDRFMRSELVDIYNGYVERKGLNVPKIS